MTAEIGAVDFHFAVQHFVRGLGRQRFAELKRRQWAAGCPLARNPVAAAVEAVRTKVTVESHELLNALMLEIHEGGAVDPDAMHTDESLAFPPQSTTGELLSLIEERFRWTERFGAEGSRPFFWYSSEENMEPRRGARGSDEGEDYELPVDILGRLEQLVGTLKTSPREESLGRFLVRNPDMRFMVGWTYTLANLDYSVARMDLLSADFSPLKIMRFQLATYGMLKFRPDPRAG